MIKSYVIYHIKTRSKFSHFTIWYPSW